MAPTMVKLGTFGLKDITLTPQTPQPKEKLALSGEITAFNLRYPLPTWLIARVTLPKGLLQLIPGVGQAEERQTGIITGGKFSLNFDLGFEQEGDYIINLEFYLGPTIPLALPGATTFAFPPFPPIAQHKFTFRVTTSTSPGEKNYQIHFSDPFVTDAVGNITEVEPDGSQVTINLPIVNNSGFDMSKVTVALQIREDSVYGRGSVIDTIRNDTPFAFKRNDSLKLRFPWKVSGALGKKSANIAIYEDGAPVANHDYSFILTKAVKRILTVQSSSQYQPSGVTIATTPNKSWYQDGEYVTVSIPSDFRGEFDHWEGDTDLGYDGNHTISLRMDRDRTVTAYWHESYAPPSGPFAPPAAPPVFAGIAVTPINVPKEATKWSVEFQPDSGGMTKIIVKNANIGKLDVSSAVMSSYTNRGYFQCCFYDTNQRRISSAASKIVTYQSGAEYTWDIKTKDITVGAPPTPIQPPSEENPVISFKVAQYGLEKYGAAFWRGEHFDRYGNMDYHSEFKAVENNSVWLKLVSAQGHVGIAYYDISGNHISTYYTDPFKAVHEYEYQYFF